MKIVRVEAWPVPLELKEPYTIAYETVEACTNVFIKLTTDGRMVGCACAAPDWEVTGENSETVLQAVREIIEPLVLGANDPLCRGQLLEQLQPLLLKQPAALALIDAALHDLLGKAANQPLWKLLGGCRESLPTCMTISIFPEEEMVARAREHVGRGFRYLKLKGGLEVDKDISCMHKVREAVGREIKLVFDANQGFNLSEARHFIDAVNDVGLECIEQPCDCKCPELLKELTDLKTVPVMADEALLTTRDAFSLAREQAVSFFSIKLMKNGGIDLARQIDAIGRSQGISTMVSCMDEAALSIAAGLHFALSTPNVPFVDLDSHFDVVDDPTAGAVLFNEGRLRPTDKPGLGFDID